MVRSPIRRTSKSPSSGSASGADLHPAAEVAAVRDDDVVHPSAPLLAVDGHPHLVVAPAREDGHRGPEVRGLPTERLRALVRALGDRAAHPGARDVGEEGLAVAPVPAAVPRPAEVDHAGPPAQSDLDGRFEASRDAVGADEVPARAARDHRQLDVLAPGDPVHDLVDGAVAADDDEQARAAVGRRPRELRELPGPLGEERVAPQPERGRRMRELGPAPAGRAVLRGGVDEEDGANGRVRR